MTCVTQHDDTIQCLGQATQPQPCGQIQMMRPGKGLLQRRVVQHGLCKGSSLPRTVKDQEIWWLCDQQFHGKPRRGLMPHDRCVITKAGMGKDIIRKRALMGNKAVGSIDGRRGIGGAALDRKRPVAW